MEMLGVSDADVHFHVSPNEASEESAKLQPFPQSQQLDHFSAGWSSN